METPPPEISYLSRSSYEAMAAIAATVDRSEREKGLTPAPGPLNAFICRFCQNVRVAVLKDPGVSLALIICDKCPPVRRIGKFQFPATPRFMQSAGFDVPAGIAPTIEFYRPTWEFYRTITHPGCKRHVETGGLLMRKIGDVFPVGFEGMLNGGKYG